MGHYLDVLLATSHGLTWVVGDAGVGKTALVREYAFRVQEHLSFICWQDSQRNTPQQVHEALLSLRSQGLSARGLIILDGFDELPGDTEPIYAEIAKLQSKNRIILTAQQVSGHLLAANNEPSVLHIGPLSRSALAKLMDSIDPDPNSRLRSDLEEVVDLVDRSPALVRLMARALRYHSLHALYDDVKPENIVPIAVQIILEKLSDMELLRLQALSFCSKALTALQAWDDWQEPGDENLIEKLVPAGILTTRAGYVSFAHPLISSSLRQEAPLRALQEAVKYLASKLHDPSDERSLSLLPGISEVVEYSKIGWNRSTSGDFAELLIWMTSVWRSSQEPARAEVLCRQSIQMAIESGQPELQIRARMLQSAVAFDQGRIEEALHIEMQTTRLAAAELGDQHPISIAARGNLAISLSESGDLPQAITILREVVDSSRKILPAGHQDLVAAIHSLASCLRDAGDYTAALTLVDEACDQTPGGKLYIQLEQLRAVLLSDTGDDFEAVQVLSKLIEAIDPSDYNAANNRVTAQANLAAVMAKQGSIKEAVQAQEKAVDGYEVLLGSEHPITMNARYNLATLLEMGSCEEEALTIFQDVARARSQTLGHDHPDTLYSRGRIASLTGSMGDTAAAIKLRQDLLDDSTRVLGPSHPFNLSLREAIVGDLESLGMLMAAAAANRELTADLKSVLPIDHPMVRRAEDKALKFRHPEKA